jgi:hypothetical protein
LKKIARRRLVPLVAPPSITAVVLGTPTVRDQRDQITIQGRYAAREEKA